MGRECRSIFRFALCCFAIALAPLCLRAEDPYIESDGTTFVNTRWFMNPNGKIEIDFARTEATMPSTWQYLFGASDDLEDSPIGTRVGLFFNANGPYFHVGDAKGKWENADRGHADTERRIAAIDAKAGTYKYYVKGSAESGGNLNAGSTVANTANYPVALFGNMGDVSGLAVSNVNGSCFSKARIYRARFWTGEHCDHDYTPLVKGGVAGFIDAIDGAFVTAENPAALTAGGGTPEIDDDPFVSTYGNNYVNGANFYIDTGYNVKATTKIELDYALADNFVSGQWDVFSAQGHNFTLHINNTAGEYFLWCGPNNKWQKFTPLVSKRSTDKNVRRKVIFDNNGFTAQLTTAGFVNATGKGAGAGAATNLRLASRYDASEVKTSCAAPLKIYGLKIYEDGALVHDYVPDRRNGIDGLFDRKGDGGFHGIDRRSADAYIEGDGTLAFNTGYKMKNTSRVEVDFRYVGLLDRNCAVFGSWSSACNNTAGYKNGSGGFSIALSDTDLKAVVLTNEADLVRHKAIIDAPGGKLHYVTGSETRTESVAAGYAGLSESAYPMGLLAGVANANATAWNLPSKARIYSMRIFEKNGDDWTQVHEFLPYKSGSTVGFYDTETGGILTVANGSTSVPGYGGMGVDGKERWLVPPPESVTLKKSGGAKTVTANASGAASYRWTRNGEGVDGGEDGSFAIAWNRRGGTDVYAVRAVYDVFGAEIVGEAVEIAAASVPAGTVIIIR